MEVLQINEVKQRFRDLTTNEKQRLQQLLAGTDGVVIRKVLGPDFVEEFLNFFNSEGATPTRRRGLAAR
jgi:hypothetical protein|tara:strand:- start:7 stop:213 length:207 start_codon:yes stop_codon:yes gene_type:complete